MTVGHFGAVSCLYETVLSTGDCEFIACSVVVGSSEWTVDLSVVDVSTMVSSD